MIFARIPQEAILQLKGLRFHLFAVVQIEMFEGGGVCKLTPRELAQKYPALGNYDSLCRYRKQMISSGWLVEVVGGLVTKEFNSTDILSVEAEKPTDEISVTVVDTDKISVNDENTTDKISVSGESTDEISVENSFPLTKYQYGTDEISGTEIALNRNLEFKEEDLRAEAAEAAAAPARDPRPSDDEFTTPDEPTETDDERKLNADPHVQTYRRYFDHELTRTQKKIIRERIRDGTIWKQAVVYWAGNDHRPSSVAKICDKYDELIEEISEITETGGLKNGANRQHSHDRRSQSAIDEYRATEQLRVAAEQRRRKSPLSNNAAGSG